MKIERLNGDTIIFFPKIEIRVALLVLKALYQGCKMSFIKEAIEDIEVEIQPKLIMVVHNHICDKCFTMVNDKSDNCLKVTHDGDTMYRHQQCPPLKDKRPN